MTTAPSRLPGVLDELERLHGTPRTPLPRKALDWVLWENAAYLVPDERRRVAYLALRKATDLSAEGILGLARERLFEIAELGGMHPDRRVAKWISIAETVQEEFAGDLESKLELPPARPAARSTKFPSIGDPGADKILLFTRTHALAALESNGLRVLIRLGYAAEARSYSTTYRAATKVFEPHLARGCAWLIRAHQLLRAHGQALCKHNEPLCDGCALAEECPSAVG